MTAAAVGTGVGTCNFCRRPAPYPLPADWQKAVVGPGVCCPICIKGIRAAARAAGIRGKQADCDCPEDDFHAGDCPQNKRAIGRGERKKAEREERRD